MTDIEDQTIESQFFIIELGLKQLKQYICFPRHIEEGDGLKYYKNLRETLEFILTGSMVVLKRYLECVSELKLTYPYFDFQHLFEPVDEFSPKTKKQWCREVEILKRILIFNLEILLKNLKDSVNFFEPYKFNIERIINFLKDMSL